jgi:phage replication O-like protein O
MSKKGFRKIDNDIFNALIQVGLTGAGYQVVLTIIDRTMGFRKGSKYKEKSPISLTYFQQATKLSRQSVCDAIKQLEKRRVIIVERNSTRKTIYSLNIDTSIWETSKSIHTSELVNEIISDWSTKSHQTSQPLIANYMRTKETLKENYKERVTGKERGTGDTFSLESRVTVGDGKYPVDSSKTVHPSKVLKGNVSNVPEKEHRAEPSLEPISVFSKLNESKLNEFRAWEKKAKSILLMHVEDAEGILGKSIPDFTPEEELKALRQEIEMTAEPF